MAQVVEILFHETKIHLFYGVSAMADNLVIQGARASAAIVVQQCIHELDHHWFW